jgi:hypothetical protein
MATVSLAARGISRGRFEGGGGEPGPYAWNLANRHKERLTVLSPRLLEVLRTYWRLTPGAVSPLPTRPFDSYGGA